MTGKRGRRRRKLLDDLKERRGYSHLKEKALDRTMWRARFGRRFGSVVRLTTKWMNIFRGSVQHKGDVSPESYPFSAPIVMWLQPFLHFPLAVLATGHPKRKAAERQEVYTTHCGLMGSKRKPTEISTFTSVQCRDWVELHLQFSYTPLISLSKLHNVAVSFCLWV